MKEKTKTNEPITPEELKLETLPGNLRDSPELNIWLDHEGQHGSVCPAFPGGTFAGLKLPSRVKEVPLYTAHQLLSKEGLRTRKLPFTATGENPGQG